MSHADEVITDVNTRRVVARAREDCFTIAWDYPGRTVLEVRVLRSERGPAESADESAESGQAVVYQDVTGSFRDSGLRQDRPCYYTVFARHPGADWVRWGDYSASSAPPPARRRLGRILRKALRLPLAPAALLALCAVTVLIAVPAVALSDDEASGGEETGAAAEEPAPSEAEAAARAFVEADADVTAILAGRDATGAATAWGGSEAEPAGFTLVYRWPQASAGSVDREWPLLRSGQETPSPPYDSSVYRLRADEVSALRIDVLADGPRILQLMPVNGETDLVLREQTWAPFSWLPWFTARPWALAPVFLVLTALLLARAWQRSRAWNRRLPSMTRHDRQFIGRVAIILFLVAGFIWQVYEGWVAATGPSLGSSGSSAGDLSFLPLLLIPPGVFAGALILELSGGPHRGSWALLVLLAGAVSVFNLATALTGATTNLNLSYYILCGVLALIAIPRAFSAGKMGWSRSHSAYYG